MSHLTRRSLFGAAAAVAVAPVVAELIPTASAGLPMLPPSPMPTGGWKRVARIPLSVAERFRGLSNSELRKLLNDPEFRKFKIP